jgi:hypothetical protein
MRGAFAVLAGASLTLMACTGASEDAEVVTEETGEFDDAQEAMAVTEAPAEPTFGIEPRPVRIGFDGPEMDACGGYGEITGLNPDGDNFLSVRAAPDVDAEELDTLTSGTGVSMCETADGWIGIVYDTSGASGTGCGVSSPVADVRDYSGPCRSGWISQRFVELIAG